MNTVFREVILFIVIYIYPAPPRIQVSKFINGLYILTNPQHKLGGKKNIFIRINMDWVKTDFTGRS